jgi:branched-subunit amino acid aminotransferase/4-amino-4-deoxychorismate lyase
LLEGVTRGLVLRLAQEAQIPVAEAPLHRADLAAADELFITSTGREILPAASLDGRPVGKGAPGPVTRKLHEAFRRLADAAARGG